MYSESPLAIPSNGQVSYESHYYDLWGLDISNGLSCYPLLRKMSLICSVQLWNGELVTKQASYFLQGFTLCFWRIDPNERGTHRTKADEE